MIINGMLRERNMGVLRDYDNVTITGVEVAWKRPGDLGVQTITHAGFGYDQSSLSQIPVYLAPQAAHVGAEDLAL